MQVSEAMSRDVRVANPDQSIREAARIMAECDIGSLPVGESDRLVGIITDRDIAIRAVAQGRSPDTRVGEVMTDDIKYCYEDEDVSSVAQNMGDIQVHRLPVVSRDKRLVGIVALADIANKEGPRVAGQAVCGISTPSSQHGGASSSGQQHQSGDSQQQWGAGQKGGSSSPQQSQSGSSGRQQEQGQPQPSGRQQGQSGTPQSQREQSQPSGRQQGQSGTPQSQQDPSASADQPSKKSPPQQS